MIRRLLKRFSDIRKARQKARLFFKEHYSDFEIVGTSLRAVESERFIFAIFYREERIIYPTPYKIFAVNKKTKHVCEIDFSVDVKYRLRCYK